MAELFRTTIPNVSMHIRNIYAEGEMKPEATVKDFLTVRREGTRDVQRRLEFYNLDIIVSVGYRVSGRRERVRDLGGPGPAGLRQSRRAGPA
jgi:hypothetical protein